MNEINAIFSKISDVLTKDFLAGSLIPALVFVIGALIAIGCWLGWTPSLLWADQLGGATLAIYGSFLFIGVIGLAYMLNATRELMIAFWTGEADLFIFRWLIAIQKRRVRLKADRELSEWFRNLKDIAEGGNNEWAGRDDIRSSVLTVSETILRLRSISELLPEWTEFPARKAIDGFVSHLKEATADPQNRVSDRQISLITGKWLTSFHQSLENEKAKRAVTTLRNDLGRSLKESVERLEDQTGEEKAFAKLESAWNAIVKENARHNIETAENRHSMEEKRSLPTPSWDSVKELFSHLKGRADLQSVNEALKRARGEVEWFAEYAQNGDDKRDLWDAYFQYVAAAGIREQIRQGHGEDQFLRKFELWSRVREPRANALGNALASYNLYPRMAYSFDGDFNWLKVGNELKEQASSDPLLQRIEDSRLSLFFCITSATLALMSTLGLIVLWFNSILDLAVGALAIFLVLFLALLLYQAALISAQAMSGSLRTAFDRYSGNKESRRGLEPAEQGAVSRAFFSNLDDQRDFLWRRLLHRMDPSNGSAQRVALSAVKRQRLFASPFILPAIGIFTSFAISIVLASLFGVFVWFNIEEGSTQNSTRWRLSTAIPVSPCTTLTKESAESIFFLRPTATNKEISKHTGTTRLCFPGIDGIACTGPHEEITRDEAACVATVLGTRTAKIEDLPSKLPSRYVEVRRPSSQDEDQIVNRAALAGYTVLTAISAGGEITTDDIAFITLADAPEGNTSDPPPIPSKIELTANGSIALTPSFPSAPVNFGSVEIRHSGEIGFGAIEVSNPKGGGDFFEASGQPIGTLFFKTCSVFPFKSAEATDRLDTLGAKDFDASNCEDVYRRDLEGLHLRCHGDNVDAINCIGPNDWLEVKQEANALNVEFIDRLTEAMNAYHREEKAVLIFGHSDQEFPGSSLEVNKKLSLLRARVIAALLETKGFARKDLIASGYSDDRPLIMASTPQKRLLLNRRVEVIFIDRKEVQ